MLVDAYGRPVKAPSQDEQTASVGALHREFADHPSSGLTVSRLAEILRDAEQGNLRAQAELIEDMEEKDGHILAELSKRKRALTGLPWAIFPPARPTAAEQKNAEHLAELFEEIPDIEDLLFDVMDGVGKGYANLEIAWRLVDRVWLPREIILRPAGWFHTPPENRHELHLRDGSPNGVELTPFGWIQHLHKAKSGYVTRAGLGRVLAWPYLFKVYAVRDLAEFLEIYGLPLRLGKYPSGATDKEKATLMRAVMNIGHNAAGIVPDGMAIEFQEAAKGSHLPFEAMIAWCERTQSKAILGGTLTSQADGKTSTNALGNVHNEVRRELLESDALQVASTLTRDLVYPIAALNGLAPDGLRRAPRFRFDTSEPEDLVAWGGAVPNLVDAGFRIPVGWAHGKLGIPLPQKDEPVLARTAPAAPAVASTRMAALAAQPTPPDELERLATDMGADWERVMDPLIAPILALAAASDDFDGFRQGLTDLLAGQDLAPLIESLAQGQFAAGVWGRVNGGRA